MMATTNNKTNGVVDSSTQKVKSSASKPLWTRDGRSIASNKQHIAKQIASAEEQIDSYGESSTNTTNTGDNSTLTSPIDSCYESTLQNITETSSFNESDDMFHFDTSEEVEGDNAPGTDLLGHASTSTLTNPGDGDTYYESALESTSQRKEDAAGNDVSVPRQEMWTQDVHNVNESAITLQPASINATSILTPTHRRNSSTSRRGIRAINHMESISETGNDSSEHNQLIDMDIGNSNNGEAAAVASTSSSYSTPRRRRRMRTSGGESTESVGGNSGSTGSGRGSRGSGSRLRRSRRQGDRSNPSSSTDNNSEENNEDENTRRRRPVRSSSSNALAASLDAGMSSLRRWIRSRRLSSPPEPRPGAGSTSGHSVSSMTTMRLGEEDIFALSHTGSDPRRITTAAPSSTGSDPNIFESNSSSGFLYYRPFEVHVQNDVDVDSAIYASDDESGTRSILIHPLISSEHTVSINSTDEGGSQQQSRQRAFSEPSRASIREFFSSVYGSRAIDGMNDEPGETVTTRRLHGGLRLQHNRSASMSSAVPTSPMIAEEEVEEVDVTDQQNNEQIGDQTLATRSIDEPNILQSLSSRSGDGQLDTSDLASHEVIAHSSTLDVEPDVAFNRDNDTVVDDAQDEDLNESTPTTPDPDTEARIRWMRINRRFKFIITSVALLFSLLLFCILISWVMLTATYVLSHNKSCDVPLKGYFWLVSFQLMLDVFRADIMKWLCRWRSDSQRRVPPRVIMYNVAYLIYAMLVLRLGIQSCFIKETTCPSTAPELFYSSLVFVCLSLLAWAIIFLGYLIPFIFVAMLLTRNGYFPNGSPTSSRGVMGGRRTRHSLLGNGRISGIVGEVMPNHLSNPAPHGTLDRLRVVLLNELPDSYQKECCICMMEYKEGEVIAATPCDHVFHKRCCQEWFQLSRTCPVCRLDVPEALGMDPTVDSSHSTGTMRRGEMNMPNFIRIIRREQRNEEPENANVAVELPANNTSQADDQVQQLDV